MIRVRPFVAADAAALAGVFDRAVRIGAAGAYGEAERAAWADARRTAPDWPERLGSQITLVAVQNGAIVGFMTLGRDGHLDLAFVVPEAMGSGVAAALHDRVLVEAREHGLTRLTTEASHLARRFLLKQGWRELAEQQVTLGDQRLTNFVMDKRIGA